MTKEIHTKRIGSGQFDTPEMMNRFSTGASTIQGGFGVHGKYKPAKKLDNTEGNPQEENKPDDGETILQVIDDLVIRDPPTFIRIRNRSDPLVFRKNKLTRIDIETNAPDNYLQRINKDFILSEETGKYVAISHKQSDIRNGGIFLYLHLSDGISPTTRFDFRITLPINDTTLLEDSRQALVKEPILKHRSEYSILANLPHIVPVDRKHPYYEANQWNETTVADVKKDNEKMTIYVSMENKWYREVLLRGKYSTARRNVIQNKYVLLMAFNAYLADKFKEKREKEEIELSDFQVQELFETGTRTILTAITSEKAFEPQYDD